LESLNITSKKLQDFSGNDVNVALNKLPASTKKSEAEEDSSVNSVSKAAPQPSNLKVLLADDNNKAFKNKMSSTTCGDAAINPMCFNINVVLNDETFKAITNNGLTMTINLAS